MDKKEKDIENEMGDLVVDFNHQQNLKLKKAKTVGSMKDVESNETSTNHNSKKKTNMNGFQIGLGGKPINQKKVVATQSEKSENKKKSDIGPVASGMNKFMKQDTSEVPKKASVPMLFRRRK
jgi:hypothetical protein